jgi:hypothetical protein
MFNVLELIELSIIQGWIEQHCAAAQKRLARKSGWQK